MKAEEAPANSSNRYERILESFAASVDENCSIYAELSRSTRRETQGASPRDSEIISVCAGVSGPVLCSYVLWILSRSVEMGLKRIYFISRDGEILLEIARRLFPAFWPESSIELRYLMGSRQAWILPSFAISRREIHLYLLSFILNSSPKIIFDRVALHRHEAEPVLLKYGFAADDWERKFTVFDLKSVKALAGDVELHERIERRAREYEVHALGYLAQEGLFDDVPYALIDLGWTGASKGALEQILSRRKKPAPPFFFFGRIESKSHDDRSILQAFHFDVDRGVGKERCLPSMTVLMEMFCASTSKGMAHYELRNGTYGPVLRESNADALREWGIEVMRDSILQFAEKMARQAQHLKMPPFLPPEVCDALLKAFWLTPTRPEAESWGQFPFEEDPSACTHGRLVRRVRLVNFWRLFLYGRGFRDSSEWRGGILATLSPVARFFWKICPIGYHVRRAIKRLLKRG